MKKLLVIALLLCPAWAFGATYYVCNSATGDESGDSYENCMSVTQHNADTFSGGDTIYICDTINTLITLPSSGSSGNNIVYDLACPDHTATIDCEDTRWQGIDINEKTDITVQKGAIQNINHDNGRGIDASNTSNLTLSDITFNDIDSVNCGPIWADNSDDLRVTQCYFGSDTAAKYGVFYNGDRFEVDHNTFSGGNYTTVVGLSETTNATGSDTGSIHHNNYINVNASGVVQDDGHMIGLAGGTINSRTIDNVNIYSETITGCGEKTKGHLIEIYNSENIDIYQCAINNNYSKCIGVGTNSYDVNGYSNLCTGNSLNANLEYTNGMMEIEQAVGGCETCLTLDTVNFYNNTIADNDDPNSPSGNHAGVALICANVEGHTFQNVDVKNNIISENMESAGSKGWELYVSFGNNPTISGIDIDYNDYYRDSNTDYFIYYDGNSYTYAQFSSYQSTESQDAHSIDDDPLLDSNYYINANSPAYNVGVDVGLGLFCGSIDLGWDDPECRQTGIGITIGSLAP